MRQLQIADFLRAFEKYGYRLAEKDFKPYNLNIIGVRSSDQTPNIFNDMIFWIYKYRGGWVTKQAPITTDPGIFYLKNLCNENGTAILKPGQYLGVWEIGMHQNKYEALVQRGDFTVIRDFNRDGKLDYDSGREETGMFGINCHHAGVDSVQIDNWSAGCQVFKRLEDFNNFMIDCRKSRDNWGNLFSYTLLKEGDVNV